MSGVTCRFVVAEAVVVAETGQRMAWWTIRLAPVARETWLNNR